MSQLLNPLPGTIVPFLYPALIHHGSRAAPRVFRLTLTSTARRCQSTDEQPSGAIDRLNPSPADYSRTIFADRAEVTVLAGSGGNGCASFLREKFISEGPPNGGDGGTGGNVFIQAVQGETSLHKLARRGIMRAGNGKNGQGKSRGGERGEDLVIEVPVGTVIRELARYDPLAEQDAQHRAYREAKRAQKETGTEDASLAWGLERANRAKFLLYPAISSEDISHSDFPRLGRARRSQLAMMQPKEGIVLDLSEPSERPILLAAGAVGGLGNPHFVTKENLRPKFATKGEEGMRLTLSLELKLLADVGLVGLPNAGKSTLLRAMSNSRARVGNWAFTTLQPNVGTVVLDDNRGRPVAESMTPDGRRRTMFTIADIPGLIEDAHLNRGLGISFLRHVERAGVLAFVIDLSAGDATAALKALWREVGMYERMKDEDDALALQNDELNAELRDEPAPAAPVRPPTIVLSASGRAAAPDAVSSIAAKPWLVIGTKADLPETQDNFRRLQAYLRDVRAAREPHPSGHAHGWTGALEAIPISAIRGHGMERVREWTLSVLDGMAAGTV